MIKRFAIHGLLWLQLASVLSCSETVKDLPLHNKRVLILGNSITQNGQYVDFLEYYLRKNYSIENLDIISIGLSSETVSGETGEQEPFPRPWLHNRLSRALELTNPNLVLALYGMNDGVYSEQNDARLNNYKNGISRLINEVKAHNAEIFLLTPTPFDLGPAKDRLSYEGEIQSYKRPYYRYPEVLKDYSKWLVSLDSIKVINLNSYLNNKLIEIKSLKKDSTFIPDAVHPNTVGHYFMAKKIMIDLYPEIIINEDVISELQKLEKDSLFILCRERRQLRSKGWLEYVGYTRNNKTVKSKEIEQTIKTVKALDSEIKRFQTK